MELRNAKPYLSPFECAYCKQRPLMWWNSEHVQPRSSGGSLEAGNEVPSCPRCNTFKRNAVRVLDPYTGTQQRLFDPRCDVWADNFSKHPLWEVPVGASPVGRATAALLFRVSSERLFPWGSNPDSDLSNVTHEDVIDSLRVARGYRLANKMHLSTKHIESGRSLLSELDPQRSSPGTIEAIHRFDRLQLQIFYSRARFSDIQAGLKMADGIGDDAEQNPNPLHKTTHHRFLKDVDKARATLLQQLATRYSLEGQTQVAAEYERNATMALWQREQRSEALSSGDRLRRLAYLQREEPNRKLDPEVATREWELQQDRSLSWLCHLADVITSAPSTVPCADEVLNELDRWGQLGGYGQDSDLLYAVLCRRRWWLLKTRVDDKVASESLMESDLKLWDQWELHNEVRQLAFGLASLASIGRAKGAAAAVNHIRYSCDQ